MRDARCAVSLAVFLLALTPENASAQQRWCGTDAPGIGGALSTLIPQQFPSNPDPAVCGGRVAALWKGCRAHDVCYWHLGVPIDTCHQRISIDLARECRRAFRTNVKRSDAVSCRRQERKCLATAATFAGFVRKYDRLFQTAAAARREARRVLARIRNRIGLAQVSRRRAFINRRIAHHCARIKVANVCDDRRVAARVIAEL
ncbi:MAG: hypothetical protein AAFQ35_01550 [Pseudomonadota bacterium]